MRTFSPLAVLCFVASVSAYTLNPSLISALAARDIDVEDYLYARELAARAPPYKGAVRHLNRASNVVNAGTGFIQAGQGAINAFRPGRRDLADVEDMEDLLYAREEELVARAPPYKAAVHHLNRASNVVNAGTGFIQAGQGAINAFRPGKRDLGDVEDGEESGLFAREALLFDDGDDYEYDYEY